MTTCAVEHCKSNSHHTLLHVDPELPEGLAPNAVCNVMCDPGQWSCGTMLHSCLDIVPVRVCTEGKEVIT